METKNSVETPKKSDVMFSFGEEAMGNLWNFLLF